MTVQKSRFKFGMHFKHLRCDYGGPGRRRPWPCGGERRKRGHGLLGEPAEEEVLLGGDFDGGGSEKGGGREEKEGWGEEEERGGGGEEEKGKGREAEEDVACCSVQKVLQFQLSR